jgi:alcohol dehydrogenase class IV
VVAASGFDVLCHAMESFTARPFTARPKPAGPRARPMSQGANPWSDVGSLEALRLSGRFLVRAVKDASDTEARERMSWAATLAGIAFGNAGVHLPHGMSYAVAGLVRDFHAEGYPEGPLVPHGISVVVSAPAVARFTAVADPARHLDVTEALGGDVRGASNDDAGELLAKRLEELMRATSMPNGAGGVGYGPSDLAALTEGAIVQQRLLSNAPRAVDRASLSTLFQSALSYW